LKDDTKKRGVFTTIWLVLVIILNTIYLTSAIRSALSPETEAAALDMTVSSFRLYALALGLVSLVSIVGAIYLFAWKKIGLRLMIGAVVVSILLNLIVGASIVPGLILAIVTLILNILIWPKMKAMS
jgi:hypothetical protein